MTLVTEARPGINGVAWREKVLWGDLFKFIPPILGSVHFLARVLPKGTEDRAVLSENLGMVFFQQPEESQVQYQQKIAKLACGILLCAAAFIVPMNYLPSEIALPAASIAFTVVVGLALHGKEIPKKVKVLFQYDQSKPLTEERVRVFTNGLDVTVGIFTAVMASLFLPEILSRSSKFQVWYPYQYAPVVFGEYAFLAIRHGLSSYSCFHNAKRLEGTFYAFNALLSLAFPVLYLYFPPMRIHHSWYGQALKLAPSLNVKLLGSVLSASSLNYIASSAPFGPGPGYYSWMKRANGTVFNKKFNVYGMDNVTLDNKNSVIRAVPAVCLEALGMFLQASLYSKDTRENKDEAETEISLTPSIENGSADNV